MTENPFAGNPFMDEEWQARATADYRASNRMREGISWEIINRINRAKTLNPTLHAEWLALTNPPASEPSLDKVKFWDKNIADIEARIAADTKMRDEFILARERARAERSG